MTNKTFAQKLRPLAITCLTTMLISIAIWYACWYLKVIPYLILFYAIDFGFLALSIKKADKEEEENAAKNNRLGK